MEQDNRLTTSTWKTSRNGLIKISESTLEVTGLSTAEAIKKGTMMTTVNRYYPSQLKMFLLGEIVRVVRAVEAKVTLRDNDEIKDVVKELVQAFPTLRMEEMRQVFDGMIFGKYGKYYERLKAAEFMEAFRQHEASEERVQAFETAHKRTSYAVAVHSPDELQAVLKECVKRGYTLRKDNTTKGQEVRVMYVVIDGGVFDYEVQADLEVVSVQKFTAPVDYTKAGQQIQARQESNGNKLRKALHVDPKVMAEYMMSKPSDTFKL
jgi:hypothetical protein